MKSKKIVKLVVNFSLIIILIVGTVIGNIIANENELAISSLLCPAIIDEESLDVSSQAGQAMSKRIMEEGAILLQNNDNTLPFDRTADNKVNVFGWRSIDWIYGSEGQNASGGVRPEDNDISKNVDIYKALKNYGIAYNKELYDMYNRYLKPTKLSENLRGAHISTVTPLREPKLSDTNYYSNELKENAKNYSDVAIVVIGRMAGEGMNASPSQQIKAGPGASNDNSRHYLEISTEEEELLTWVGANFEKVLVLLNVSNPFECGFMKTIPGLDSCMYIGFTGTRGIDGLTKVLYGEVSPSGHTVDTFPYDEFTNPANNFLGGLNYTNYGRSYVDYMENIYVGYKWYETADKEGFWNGTTNNFGSGYNAVVQYPFGYGMSYTTFDWEVTEISAAPNSNVTDADFIDFTIKVTNTGKYPGRDVIEGYVTMPYTKGGIEKPAVALVNDVKTEVIAPGASLDVTLTVDVDDFKSYDCYDMNANAHAGYELEKGDYVLKLMTDAHNVKEVTYNGAKQAAEFTYKVAQTINIDKDKTTGETVKNLFTGDDAIDRVPIDSKSSDFDPQIKWFTRAAFTPMSDWASLYTPRAINPHANDGAGSGSYSVELATEWDNATTDAFGDPVNNGSVTWGAKNGLTLSDSSGKITELGEKLGANYDAEEWGSLLDQLSIDDIKSLVNRYYGTTAIASVGKPALADLDGPAQIAGFTSRPNAGTGYPTMVVIASTWNQKLAYEFGKSYGDDMKSIGVYGVWGWAMDCHRTAFFGRNHESPSEDSHLAGMIISNAVKGLNTRGRYCFIKHFALYGYGGDNVWLTEQALRENYLEGFRMAFAEGGALGCMTTYQGVGAEHSETTEALLNGVLRKEWKFRGAITTDYISTNIYCDSIIRCGGDLGMGVAMDKTAGVSYTSSSTNRLQNRLREIGHHVLYTWLHADYYEKQYLATPDTGDSIISSTSIQSWNWWKPLLVCLDALVGCCCFVWASFVLTDVFMPGKKQEEAGIKE